MLLSRYVLIPKPHCLLRLPRRFHRNPHPPSASSTSSCAFIVASCCVHSEAASTSTAASTSWKQVHAMLTSPVKDIHLWWVNTKWTVLYKQQKQYQVSDSIYEPGKCKQKRTISRKHKHQPKYQCRRHKHEQIRQLGNNNINTNRDKVTHKHHQ